MNDLQNDSHVFHSIRMLGLPAVGVSIMYCRICSSILNLYRVAAITNFIDLPYLTKVEVGVT